MGAEILGQAQVQGPGTSAQQAAEGQMPDRLLIGGQDGQTRQGGAVAAAGMPGRRFAGQIEGGQEAVRELAGQHGLQRGQGTPAGALEAPRAEKFFQQAEDEGPVQHEQRGLFQALQRSGYDITARRDEIIGRARNVQTWLDKYAPDYVKFQVQESLRAAVKILSESERRGLGLLAERVE